MRLSFAASIVTLCGHAVAHGGVTAYNISGVTYPAFQWFEPLETQKDLIQRTWHMNPLSDLGSTNLTCNNKGAVVPGAYHARVRAGEAISATWTSADGYSWPHSIGPVLAYMADCGADCTTVADTSALRWFKIAETGLREGFALGAYKGWFQNDLHVRDVTERWEVTVPKGLRPGRYMLRHEIIMLELDPIQFYPNCAHLEVVGEGDAVPGEEYLVQFPGGYSMSDPGIAISGKVYGDKTTKNYTIPGPKLWVG